MRPCIEKAGGGSPELSQFIRIHFSFFFRTTSHQLNPLQERSGGERVSINDLDRVKD